MAAIQQLLMAVAAAAAAPITFTFQASATSTGSTLVIPATAAAGDIAFLFDAPANSSGIPALVVPTGFASVDDTPGGTFFRGTISAKVLVGGDPGATITGENGAFNNMKGMLVFRPSRAVSAINAASINGQGTTGDPAAQTVLASAATLPAIVLAHYRGIGTGLVTPTFSPAEDGSISAATGHSVRYKIYNSSPADVTVDEGDSGADNILQSLYFTCT